MNKIQIVNAGRVTRKQIKAMPRGRSPGQAAMADIRALQSATRDLLTHELLQLSTRDYRYLVSLVRQRIASYRDAATIIRRRRNMPAERKTAEICAIVSEQRLAEAVLRNMIAPANRPRMTPI